MDMLPRRPPDAPPTIRLRGYFMAAGASVLALGLILSCYVLGALPADALLPLAGGTPRRDARSLRRVPRRRQSARTGERVAPGADAAHRAARLLVVRSAGQGGLLVAGDLPHLRGGPCTPRARRRRVRAAAPPRRSRSLPGIDPTGARRRTRLRKRVPDRAAGRRGPLAARHRRAGRRRRRQDDAAARHRHGRHRAQGSGAGADAGARRGGGGAGDAGRRDRRADRGLRAVRRRRPPDPVQQPVCGDLHRLRPFRRHRRLELRGAGARIARPGRGDSSGVREQSGSLGGGPALASPQSRLRAARARAAGRALAAGVRTAHQVRRHRGRAHRHHRAQALRAAAGDGACGYAAAGGRGDRRRGDAQGDPDDLRNPRLGLRRALATGQARDRSCAAGQRGASAPAKSGSSRPSAAARISRRPRRG